MRGVKSPSGGSVDTTLCSLVDHARDVWKGDGGEKSAMGNV